jgi:hypothetical protein
VGGALHIIAYLREFVYAKIQESNNCGVSEFSVMAGYGWWGPLS